ncbi:MAG: hypothetical protein QHH15_05225 [Candidatus Thermoplasmatota archaeon]|nr:hypothetical protein [Candidatus Thermoplasmatota archaeon]
MRVFQKIWRCYSFRGISGNTNITSLQNVSYNTIDVGTGSGGDRATAISFMSSYSGSGPIGDGRYTNILISYNVINNLGNNKRGISLYNDAFGDGSKGEISGSVIRGNVINGIVGQSPNFGIRLAGLVTGTVVEENTVTNCDKSFLGTTARNSYSKVYPTGTIVNYNNFEGNSGGLVWEGSFLLDARFNWWGDASGPCHVVLNPDGLGDNVSGNVSFAPWFDAAYPGGSLTSAPPQISNIVLTNSTSKDTDPIFGWENITVTVTDDVEVSDVRINISYPDMHTENISMIHAGRGVYYYNTTLTSIGTHNNFIWAVDTTSVSKTSNINPYVKPPNWDINMDGICNILDVTGEDGISVNWLKVGASGWIRADINNDGLVNILDVSIISLYWMQTWL